MTLTRNCPLPRCPPTPYCCVYCFSLRALLRNPTSRDLLHLQVDLELNMKCRLALLLVGGAACADAFMSAPPTSASAKSMTQRSNRARLRMSDSAELPTQVNNIVKTSNQYISMQTSQNNYPHYCIKSQRSQPFTPYLVVPTRCTSSNGLSGYGMARHGGSSILRCSRMLTVLISLFLGTLRYSVLPSPREPCCYDPMQPSTERLPMIPNVASCVAKCVLLSA